MADSDPAAQPRTDRAPNDWRPMSANVFPWPHKDVIIVAFAKDDPKQIEIFACRCGEHGAYFPANTAMVSIIELGWIPFAFRTDDTPHRDDAAFPPMWSDYLTEPSHG